MAKGKMATCLVLFLVAMFCGGARAQSSCTSLLISLSPCLNYITGNSSSTPSQQCCTQLASVVRSSPQCLCEVLNGGASSLGITINQTQALALPGACGVQTPPVSTCNATSQAPADSPVGSPESGGIFPPGGSKTVPSTQENGSSGGSTTKFSLSVLAFLLLATSYGSIFSSH